MAAPSPTWSAIWSRGPRSASGCGLGRCRPARRSGWWLRPRTRWPSRTGPVSRTGTWSPPTSSWPRALGWPGSAWALRPRPDPDRAPGALSYAAPELAEGGPATPAADMYALGVVFLACLRRRAWRPRPRPGARPGGFRRTGRARQRGADPRHRRRGAGPGAARPGRAVGGFPGRTRGTPRRRARRSDVPAGAGWPPVRAVLVVGPGPACPSPAVPLAGAGAGAAAGASVGAGAAAGPPAPSGDRQIARRARHRRRRLVTVGGVATVGTPRPCWWACCWPPHPARGGPARPPPLPPRRPATGPWPGPAPRLRVACSQSTSPVLAAAPPPPSGCSCPRGPRSTAVQGYRRRCRYRQSGGNVGVT